MKERRGTARFWITAGLAMTALAVVPGSALAEPCNIDAASAADPGNALFDSGGFEWDTAEATVGNERNFAALLNGRSNGPGGNPPSARFSDDAWDVWGALFVGAGGDASDANLYASLDNNACTREDGGRELVFPKLTVNGLIVQRKLFVASSGLPGARLLELVTNPGSAPITTAVQVGVGLAAPFGSFDLGSDNLTLVRSSSSGDAALTTADLWAVTSDHQGGTINADPALAHVIDATGGRDRIDAVTPTGPGAGNALDDLAFRWDGVTILPGQTAALMSFEVQQALLGANATAEDAAAQSQAEAIENAAPKSTGKKASLYASGESSSALYAGMSRKEVGSLRNWPTGLSCFGKEPTIVGDDTTKDVLKGTKGADVIMSFGGKDKVRGRGGKDRICGGNGKDRLSGGGGNDKIDGGKGPDELTGGKGKDDLSGGKGKDVEKQ